MAKIMYVLKKNMNEKSDNFGRWFAQVKSLETLGLRKMAEHIAEHGFYTTCENKKGGAESKEKFVTQDIKALHIRFLPEQTAEMDISSRQFIKRAEFINADTWVNGKEEETPQPEP